MTVEEDEILYNAMKYIKPHFIIRFQKLWKRFGDYPHKNWVILTKKPSAFRR